MRRFVTVLTAAVAVAAFSTMVFAQATTTPAKPVAAAKTAATAKPAVAQAPEAKPVAKPAVKPAAKLTAKGEGKYDEATKTLTVGDKTFTLAPDAKIMMGAKAATVADVTGKHVMVTYSVVDGKDVASKVTIAAAKPAPKAKEPVKK